MKALVLQDVDKAFGGQQVLAGFSARFEPGSATALLGPSGRGKTTLLRLLLGLETPDAGRVDTAGARFGCVFQEDRLCPGLSAVENVALVLPREGRTGILPALEALGLAGANCHKPAGTLSGGQKRRVALARAIEAPGDVLLLDEAFKGLDAENKQRAVAYINARRQGRTLLVVTHEAEDAALLGAQVLDLGLL